MRGRNASPTKPVTPVSSTCLPSSRAAIPSAINATRWVDPGAGSFCPRADHGRDPVRPGRPAEGGRGDPEGTTVAAAAAPRTVTAAQRQSFARGEHPVRTPSRVSRRVTSRSPSHQRPLRSRTFAAVSVKRPGSNRRCAA